MVLRPASNFSFAEIDDGRSYGSPSLKPALKFSERILFPELAPYYKHKNDAKTKGLARQKTIKKLSQTYAPSPAKCKPSDSKSQGFLQLMPKADYLGGHLHYTCAAQGPRSRQEDGCCSCTMTINVNGQQKKIPFFGVYDGHDGFDARDFLVDNVHTILQEKLSKINIEDFVQLKLVFKAAFVEADGKFRAQYPKSFSGSTALVACVIDNILWTANVGDCRAVLVSKDQSGITPIQLTQDAVATEQPFLSSLEKREYSGRFCYKQEHNVVTAEVDPRTDSNFLGEVFSRVVISEAERKLRRLPNTWPLISARTIGDKCLPGVSPRPKVSAFNLKQLDRRKEHYLVLATDGLWNTLSTKDAASVAAKTFHLNDTDDMKVTTFSQSLLHTAYQKGSDDNATVTVVKL